MSTTVIEPVQRTTLEPRQCLVLDGIDWTTYRKLSAALTDRHVRLTFDRGVLELMTKSSLHELLSRLWHNFLVVLIDEHDLPLACFGSMTCDREDLDRGAEPDECYYFVNAPLVRGKSQIDLAKDPPPDLVVEIPLSSSSRRRLGVYAALKVPEVWQADADSLTVLHLDQDGTYAKNERSIYFPEIPLAEVVAFAQRQSEVDHMVLLRAFRAWVRTCLGR